MGANELALERARNAVAELTETVRDKFPDKALAQLWAASQLSQALQHEVDQLLTTARQAGFPGGRRPAYTWEELGRILGVSSQGARQRYLRRGRYFDLDV